MSESEKLPGRAGTPVLVVGRKCLHRSPQGSAPPAAVQGAALAPSPGGHLRPAPNTRGTAGDMGASTFSDAV